jgi:hypothetical protein
MLQRVTTYGEVDGEVERIAFAKWELFAQGTLQSAEPASLSKGKYDLRCWIYLAASAAATLGWIWFLARVALGLLLTMWGFLQNI